MEVIRAFVEKNAETIPKFVSSEKILEELQRQCAFSWRHTVRQLTFGQHKSAPALRSHSDIETEAQLNLLARNRCDEMQGSYFSRPLPCDACTEFLKQDFRLSTNQLLEVGDRRTVLIVDDDLASHALLAKMLSDIGYDVATAVNAFEGMEILARQDNVSIVISDNRMSAMNGLDFLANVKKCIPKLSGSS